MSVYWLFNWLKMKDHPSYCQEGVKAVTHTVTGVSSGEEFPYEKSQSLSTHLANVKKRREINLNTKKLYIFVGTYNT